MLLPPLVQKSLAPYWLTVSAVERLINARTNECVRARTRALVLGAVLCRRFTHFDEYLNKITGSDQSLKTFLHNIKEGDDVGNQRVRGDLS